MYKMLPKDVVIMAGADGGMAAERRVGDSGYRLSKSAYYGII